eukprot:CAMPEP_0114540914 /NCGR_PEP_ID=MMETSP0114-20121206/1024_1 /TAXON_ID=31324 /ORGANISM="Goniomonas sp, Strain m" /LENGTH=82 /DNA_ID=CAMNT_0001725113 /DNA_START=32 /DNA_END=280 /DNA_ORIENTATION=+
MIGHAVPYWSKKLPFASRWIKTEAMPVIVVVGAGVTMCCAVMANTLFGHPHVYANKQHRLKGLAQYPYPMGYPPEKKEDPAH